MSKLKMFAIDDSKQMSNGMRNTSRTPLTAEEIEYVKSEIMRIEADESVFVFNDINHIGKSTCYNVLEDKIYVTRNVFPDEKYGSTHPRDVMSVGAVLAHEYYGHRMYKEEYLQDIENDTQITPYWQDECRASVTAARIAPNLTERDKCNLVQDAVFRAQECGYLLEMDDFMKEAVYGYSNRERNITRDIPPLKYVNQSNQRRNDDKKSCDSHMSKVRKFTKDYDDFER